MNFSIEFILMNNLFLFIATISWTIGRIVHVFISWFWILHFQFM
jgi:hypothetical protein